MFFLETCFGNVSKIVSFNIAYLEKRFNLIFPFRVIFSIFNNYHFLFLYNMHKYKYFFMQHRNYLNLRVFRARMICIWYKMTKRKVGKIR